MQTTAKNILYVGPYRQADGWGLAAQGYLLSLLSTHHNVVSVPIYLNASSVASITNKQILEAEERVLSGYDLIIQKSLPQAMIYNGSAKNIGMFFLENNKLVSDSVQNLNAMDELWVTSIKEQKCLTNSGVSTPTHIVSHPLPTEDMRNIQQKELRVNFGKPVDDEYKFYFIGEHIQRKNIKDIVAAFHLEFDVTEPVRLIIKTSIPGVSPKAAEYQIKQELDLLKQKLRIRNKFKDEIIITEKVSQSQLFSLHNACDCFVSTSYGEAFCRPAAEALCFGKHAILAANIGVLDSAEAGDCSIIGCQEQPVIVENTTYLAGLDMYNGYETWSVPSILDLQKHMRQAYTNRPQVDKEKYLNKFSYQNIGNILCQYIQ